MSKGVDHTTVEESGGDMSPYHAPTKRQKASRHCRKWWWVWLIAFGLFVMTIMLIVVYGVIPRVAQKTLDKTELHLNSLNIMSPAATSFQVSFNGTITGATGVAEHARIEPFEVDLFFEGNVPIRPIMSLRIDELHGGAAVPVVKEGVDVDIRGDQVDEFAFRLMDSEEMRVAMRGDTKIWLGKLSSGIVHYNEVVTMKGLNKLQGMVITSYDLVEDGNFNVAGEVLIPNPTVVTLQLGDVSLNIALKKDKLGTGVIPSLTLTPGNNTYPFKASIKESLLLSMAIAANNGESLTISSNGTSVDGKDIPWLSKPLKMLDTQVPVDTKYFDEKE